MKKYLFLLLSILTFNMFSQIEDPVQWSFSVEQISERTYNLVIEADIENGWNVYSQYVDPDGPIPTSFSFFLSKDFKLIDSVTESNPKTKYDPVFQMDLSSFQNKAVFKQKVKVLNDNISSIKGELEFMACNSTMCLPPDYVDMLFVLKKKDKNSSQELSNTNENLQLDKDQGVAPWIGPYQGVCPPFNMKNKNGDDLVLNAKNVIQPETAYIFELFNDNTCLINFVSENTSYECDYFRYDVIENNDDFIITMFPDTLGDCGAVPFIIEKKGDLFLVSKKSENLIDYMPEFEVTKSNKYSISSVDLNDPLGDCGEKKGEKSLWGIFLLGIVGGLIALLTPCVFPMIPLTVSFFTKGSENRAKAIYNAALYGIFIFATYTLLSLPFHLMPNINPEVLNQISTNPWLNISFFVIFLVFAISFFGYFEITLPSSWSTRAGSGRDLGGILGIFFMALTLAIVSFSCTGPILGSLLAGTLSSATADSISILGFDTALVSLKLSLAMAGFGIALGLPFALFAAFPSWLQSLPKSGGWLNNVKVILGFLEIALAIKFLSNADLVEQWGVLRRETFFGLWCLTFAGLALYLFGYIKFPHDNPNAKLGKSRLLFGSVVLCFVIYLLPGLFGKDWWSHKLLSGFPPPKYYSYINHEHQITNIFHDYDEGIAYAKKYNKPVMIDFTGWACVNCRKVEDDVWVEKRVKKMLNQDYVVISLYVDEKILLSKDDQETVLIKTRNGKLKKKKIRRVGDKWSTLQSLTFSNNTQPLHVLMTPDERLLGNPIGYSYAKNVNNYVDYLECGLEAFESLNNN